MGSFFYIFVVEVAMSVPPSNICVAVVVVVMSVPPSRDPTGAADIRSQPTQPAHF